MSDYYVAIALSFFGFIALAAILLVPVYRFLRRQESQSEDWTPEALAERRRRHPPGDGAAGPPPQPPA